MNRKFLWWGAVLLALLILPSSALADPPAPHQAITEYTGPETCAMCHPNAATEVVNSLHYQMVGEVPYREGWPEGELGGMGSTY